MDWLLQHLQLLIAGAGAVAWWLNQRKQRMDDSGTKPTTKARREDPDFAERTRRIREEIQRKIEQRTRGEVPSSTARRREEKPVPALVNRQSPRAEPPPLSSTGMTPEEANRTTEMLAKQAAIAEQLRQVVELKTAALRRIQNGKQISSGEQTGKITRGVIVEDLKNVATLRRAFILREIIGPPVGLR